MTSRPNVARVAIALGVVGSMAGNVTWAWPRSPVLVGVGVAMSLVLPVAVKLWGASRGVTGWPRVERAIVMGAICGGAALYTLVHSSALLSEKGLPWLIAWVPATVMELLVVQAARASAPVTAARAKPAPKPKTPAQPRRDTAPPRVTAAPDDESPEDKRKRLARERQARRRARQRQEAVA